MAGRKIVRKESKDDSLQIQEFIDNLVAKNFSGYTIANYKKDILDFKEFITKERLALSLLDINNKGVVTTYIESLSIAEYKPTSINRKISSLRTFYKFLELKGWIDENVFLEVSNVKQKKALPRFIDSADLIDFINNIDIKTSLGYRNKVLFELMFASGMRGSEICNLEISNLNLYSGEIKVFCKGKKERIVFIYDSLRDDLKYYIDHIRNDLLVKSMDLENRKLFINYKGSSLTPRGVRKILNKEIEKRSLAMHVTPHMLRHSFATAMLDSGLDLRSVQTLLGHENLATTQIYTHITKTKIKETFDKAFPRAKKID